MTRSFLPPHGRGASFLFASPMPQTLCKGWTIDDGMALPSKYESIARLACELRAMVRSEVCCSTDEPCVNEPKIIQAESLSIQCHWHWKVHCRLVSEGRKPSIRLGAKTA